MMVFITQANAANLACKVDKARLGEIAGEIYKRRIGSVFGPLEEKELLLIQELFRDPIDFVEEYYKKFRRVDTHQYVSEGKSPAYHLLNTCGRLLSDYENYKVPAPIIERGQSEVAKFRVWFAENKALLETSSDRFYVRLSSAFKVSITAIEKIHHANTGPELFENVDLEEIEARIERLLLKLDEWFEAGSLRADIILFHEFYRKTFLRNRSIEYNPTRFDKAVIQRVLSEFYKQFKKPLHDILITYYKVLYNPDLSFENDLLDQLGFKPCSRCYGAM